MILTATMVAVLVSLAMGTIRVDTLKHRLLEGSADAEPASSPQRHENRRTM
jgi:hypothetical protein